MATIYEPRTTAPATNNKNWIHYSKGGYNYAILISGNSCLPNCVGYVWGRWRELLGKKHALSVNNAEDFWGKADGYKRGQKPKLGAVICWRGGKAGDPSDGRGHVGIVEDDTYSDGSILCSMSDAGGSRFYTMKLKPPYKLAGMTLQGFIYPPVTYTAKKESKPKEVTATAYATHFNASLAGSYKTTAALHCRNGAGTNQKSLVVIPKGKTVKCYGYYSVSGGVKWLCIQFTLNGTTYTGFSSAEYLTKIS